MYAVLSAKSLPGFGKYDTEIVIAGEGTNYSNLPIESSVPLEEVVKERTGEGGQAPKPDTNKEKKQPGSNDRKTTSCIYLSFA